MEINAVWGVYFSATGTTERVVTHIARKVADLLGAEYRSFSFSLPGARSAPLAFDKRDLVVFGIPVYAGRIPNLLLPFIRDSVSGNGALAVPVTMFGNRDFDDALIELRNVLQGNGFYTIAAGAFVGEHSFSDILGAGRPDGDDMEKADFLAEMITAKIKVSDALPIEAVPVRGNDPIRPYYTPRDRHGNPINILKVKPKTDLAKCVNCGRCAEVCTMGSINPDDVSEIGGVCTKCCACVKLCPVGAKYFDDEGYLFHKRELEEVCARRAETELFW